MQVVGLVLCVVLMIEDVLCAHMLRDWLLLHTRWLQMLVNYWLPRQWRLWFSWFRPFLLFNGESGVPLSPFLNWVMQSFVDLPGLSMPPQCQLLLKLSQAFLVQPWRSPLRFWILDIMLYYDCKLTFCTFYRFSVTTLVFYFFLRFLLIVFELCLVICLEYVLIKFFL